MPSIRIIRFAILDAYSGAAGEIEPVVIKMPFVALTRQDCLKRLGLPVAPPHSLRRIASLGRKRGRAQVRLR
jgi:hypothetical protein